MSSVGGDIQSRWRLEVYGVMQTNFHCIFTLGVFYTRSLVTVCAHSAYLVYPCRWRLLFMLCYWIQFYCSFQVRFSSRSFAFIASCGICC